MQYDVTGGDNVCSHRIHSEYILGTSIIIGGEL